MLSLSVFPRISHLYRNKVVFSSWLLLPSWILSSSIGDFTPPITMLSKHVGWSRGATTGCLDVFRGAGVGCRRFDVGSDRRGAGFGCEMFLLMSVLGCIDLVRAGGDGGIFSTCSRCRLSFSFNSDVSGTKRFPPIFLILCRWSDLCTWAGLAELVPTVVFSMAFLSFVFLLNIFGVLKKGIFSLWASMCAEIIVWLSSYIAFSWILKSSRIIRIYPQLNINDVIL